MVYIKTLKELKWLPKIDEQGRILLLINIILAF